MASRNWCSTRTPGPKCIRKAEALGSEYVIAVEGTVARRTAETVNAALPTGEVELVVEKLWILNESRTPPFPMEETVDVKEDARLKYRYVDLRRPHMQRNIMLRSQHKLCRARVSLQPGFSRNRNAFHDALYAGGRARLSGAQPRPSPVRSTRCRNRRRSSSNC